MHETRNRLRLVISSGGLLQSATSQSGMNNNLSNNNMKRIYLPPVAEKLEPVERLGLLTSFSYEGYVEDFTDIEELTSTLEESEAE